MISRGAKILARVRTQVFLGILPSVSSTADATRMGPLIQTLSFGVFVNTSTEPNLYWCAAIAVFGLLWLACALIFVVALVVRVQADSKWAFSLAIVTLVAVSLQIAYWVRKKKKNQLLFANLFMKSRFTLSGSKWSAEIKCKGLKWIR
jgi:hypothetical protein